MNDSLERAFNRLSDQDWTWWPFLRLRPPQDRPFTNGGVARIALVFGSFAGLLIGALLLVLGVAPLGLEGAMRVAFLFAASVVVCIAVVFVLFRLTAAAAWNQRARRLSGTR